MPQQRKRVLDFVFFDPFIRNKRTEALNGFLEESKQAPFSIPSILKQGFRCEYTWTPGIVIIIRNDCVTQPQTMQVMTIALLNMGDGGSADEIVHVSVRLVIQMPGVGNRSGWNFAFWLGIG